MKTVISKIPKLLFATAILFFTHDSSAADFYLPSESFMLDGEYPNHGVIGDFNDDGIDDLAAVFPIPDPVTGAFTTTRINFLVGNSNSTMKIETTFPLPFNVSSMATGDFNNDGNPDLAVAQDKTVGVSDPYCGIQQGTVIFLGLHNESEPDLEFSTCLTDTLPNELWTLDANGDNFSDLIVSDQLFLSNGDGSFTAGDLVPAGNKTIADINSDGREDVVTDEQAVCSDGSGGMESCPLPANDPLVDTDQEGNIVGYQARKAALPVSQQASADVNGDGIDDLVGAAVTSLEYPVFTAYRKCGWTTQIVNVYRPGAGRGRSRTGGSYSRRSVKWYRCWTSSYYTSGSTLVSTTSPLPIPEMSALRISLMGSDGSVEQVMGPEVLGYIRSVKVTDVNGDGHLDVLADIARVGNQEYNAGVLYSDTDWKMFTGNGDGTFNEAEPTGLPLEQVFPGDFNGDGLTDFGSYLTPFDTEHMLSVTFHNPPATPVIPADTTPPSVAITSLADGGTVSGTVQLTAIASDDTRVANVTFQSDGNTIGQITAAPYHVSWDTSNLATGNYTLQVVATDEAGNSSTASISVTLEAPATTSPAPDQTTTSTSSSSSAQPTGEQLEFSGTIIEADADYFILDDGTRISIGANSVLKYQDGFGLTPKVGDPAEGKADEYSDGSYVLVKADFGV
jgi:Big-like domain-containing protein/VCBS repeat protein